ncbi:MAG TPA: sugar ABC transporter permease [Thermoclostridium sp.]|nr:sugar ABC transporter permease [Clostridiaceae bacterium]HOQ75681.1 sugar ABC transporter permease [Thermoclostridium sp.]HPU45943.1 sugar ABC transporter permease [Thermoclostridium sp.]
MRKVLSILNHVLTYTILVVLSVMVLYPIAFAIGGAFSPGKSLANLNILPFPANPTLDHFDDLFNRTNYILWYRNTFTIAVANTLVVVSVTLISAYIFSRFRFKLKKPMLMSFLILQMFPSVVGVIAIYVILNRLALSDSYLGLILVYSAGALPYNIWLIKGYFDTFPRSVDEAARVDGAGNLTVFFRIVIPNTLPIIAFLGITSFMAPWMDFILPRFILRSDSKKTLAVGLFEMITGRSNDNFTMFAAGALLVAVPFVILFVINQKYLVKVMAAGAVKE